ncbi:MAG: hypothetical protein L3J54_11480 [Draconibacterium sp.]|nr:hypothetical protein [Draconibacterium sp.]
MKRVLKYITIFFIVTFIVAATNLLFAGAPDSLRQQTSFSSEKILNLKTVWSGSANPASLQFFDIQQKIGKAYLNFNNESGDFHRYRQEKTFNEIGFFTSGYVTLDKWKFYGNFNYSNSKNEGINWTDVLNPYDDNPYILADSVGGTYHKEYFTMQGKASWQIDNMLTFGVDINYNAGVGARRKDPRPKNITTTFDISPAIIFSFNKIKLGANFSYQTSKEDIEISTVTDSIYSFFNFKGLGAYSVSTEKDNRSHESNLFGGGIQIGFNGNKLNNLTEVNFYRKSTDIKRGVSFPLQVVLLEKYSTNVTSTFMFLRDVKTINKLKIYFADKHIYGHEPVVEPKLEQYSYQWSTLAKYTLYWHIEQKYGLGYSYFKLIDANHLNWGGTISGEVTTIQSTYYFVPETNEQTLNYFNLKGSFEKEFLGKSNTLVLSVNGSYQKGFNSSYKIVNDKILLETVNTEFVAHDFNYYNAQLVKLGGAFQFGRMIKLYKSPVQLFLTGEYKRLISQMNSTNRNIFELKLGMNF